MICNTTYTLSMTAGDYCAERTTANCPLARYASEVVDTLERKARAEATGGT
jgi:hypothetical protein